MDLIWGGRNKEVCLMAFRNGNRKIMFFNVLEGSKLPQEKVLLHDLSVNMFFKAP